MAKKLPRSNLEPVLATGCIVQVPLTDEERIEYQKAAERCGQSLAEWIRQRLAEAARREAKEG